MLLVTTRPVVRVRCTMQLGFLPFEQPHCLLLLRGSSCNLNGNQNVTLAAYLVPGITGRL